MQNTPGSSPILDWAVEFIWPHCFATQLHLKTGADRACRWSVPPPPLPPRMAPASICDVLRYGVGASRVQTGDRGTKGGARTPRTSDGSQLLLLPWRRSNAGSFGSRRTPFHQAALYFWVIFFFAQVLLREFSSPALTFSGILWPTNTSRIWTTMWRHTDEEIHRC